MKNSNWIWSPCWDVQDKENPRLMLFRKKLELSEEPVEGKLCISADTRYKLYINGQLVQTGPSRGDNQVWFYDTVDVCTFLKKGINVVGVSVLRYPQDPAAGNHGMFRTSTPGLYVAGIIKDLRGSEYDLSADASWRCMTDRSVTFYREEERFAPLVIHEHAYGNRQIFGWKHAAYDDSSWEHAQAYKNIQMPQSVSPGNLMPRNIPFMYRKQRVFHDIIELRQLKDSKEDGIDFAEGRKENTILGHSQDRKTFLEGRKENTVSRHWQDRKAFLEGRKENTEPEHLQDWKVFLKGRKESTALGHLQDWKAFLKGEKEITVPGHSHVVVELDAGEEMTGYIRAAFAGGRDAEVSLLYSEAYVQDGVVGPERIPIKSDRRDNKHGHLQGYEDVYHVAGMGDWSQQEVYEPYWFRTFRFVRLSIRTAEESLTLCGLDYEETGYPLEIVSEVHTSDPSLDAIWEISARTLQRCMHETYVDCPFYEQLQYIMDARLQILYTYAVSADDRLARKCMDDLRRSQRYDGLLNCSYPNCNTNVIPGFSIYYILMVYDHMMYFGDRTLAEEHMPAIEQILHYFERHLTKEGYVEKIGGVNMEARFWSFIDWAAEWNDTSGMPPAGLDGSLTMETLLYIYGLQHSAALADFLDRTEMAEMYRDKACKAQTAVRTYCMGTDGMVQDGPGIDEYSQHCQVFALLTDTVDLETGRRNLLKTIKEAGYTQCTVAMRFYLFRALEKAGLYAFTDRYWETWRNMVKMNCTTCVESEAYARSECHAWGALILYELPVIVLGVRPAQPGIKKVQIAPVLGYLTSASGAIKTPRGEIQVSWKMEDGEWKLDYEVPQGLEIEFHADGVSSFA